MDVPARWLSGTGSADERREVLGDLAARADADPTQRQPVVEAICRFLRAPEPSARTDRGLRDAATGLLADRLRPVGQAPPRWAGIVLDLSGATLVDLDLGGCVLAGGRFADTRFQGTTTFVGTRFTGDAVFSRAVFDGPARFGGATFDGDAAFGRVRFRGPTDFGRVGFGGIAWFGRGEDEFWEDDPAWETVDQWRPLPWDEPNETDPNWPLAVLTGDYQEWSEGGVGARFGASVSFRQARFTGPAWFGRAQFGGVVDFCEAFFGAGAHLEPPTADLTGARTGGEVSDPEAYWPPGWRVAATSTGSGMLLAEEDLRAYLVRLVDPDPAVRDGGLRGLVALADDRPASRQRVVDAVCGWLRRPVPFPLTGVHTAEQAAEVRLRGVAQGLLADRLRGGTRHWPGMDLDLCAAVLVDVDLTGCRARYADFTGTQFHGVTRFDDSGFEAARFDLGAGAGVAVFHGPVTFTGARSGRSGPHPWSSGAAPL
ncbi:pentapeptide repeat-containing protein [Micromonospora sp. SH-82]|uniref:pentapeptide repeat-containing protein n=1 Tax=Micromonospora sp. SH-82 TaxID=3132938 RepID=UPI003EB6A8F3